MYSTFHPIEIRRRLFLSGWLAVAAATFPLSCAGQATNHDGDIAVKPISAETISGWTNAYRLVNEQIAVVVSPESGRIIRLALRNGENLFRQDVSLAGRSPGPKDTGWFNYGGDWLFPVAQEHWPEWFGAAWPPPRLLDGRAWSGRAWVNAEGCACCLLTQDYGEPLNVKVTRLIELKKGKPVVEIRQRIERTGVSKVPVTLWTISQVGGARQVAFPGAEKEVRPMGFDAPKTNVLLSCTNVVLYRAGVTGEHKLCSSAPASWIAAVKGDVALIESAGPTPAQGRFPDGGCRVEMYSNTGLGYTEIEILSEEKILDPGESLENTLRYRVLTVATNAVDCGLAGFLEEAAARP